jgi:glycosyltransferase involved in cell wall biosynthesis
MKRLCCVFNIPSLYREAIYLSIENNFDCEWFFEKKNTDIVLFDTNKLKKVSYLGRSNVVGRLYRMKGLTKAIWKRNDFDAYIMIGAPMCVSIWVLCLLLKVFHPHKRICFWTHGWYGKESRVERMVKDRFLKLADELFLYGEYAKDLLIKRGYRNERMHVIHNSLSYDVQLKLRKEIQPSNIYENRFGNDNPVLIFIGRLTKVKKLDLLLDSLVLLRDKAKLFNLVFVGDGVEKSNLEKKTSKLGLDKQVWFYGACYDEKTNAELIYNADLCVAPGNIGLTAMHTLMFGCPALTHNDFAYQMPEFEAIHPQLTGDFFEKDNVNSLAEAIDKWFHNDSSRDTIRNNCYKEIDEKWNPSYQIKVIKTVLS